MGTPYQHLREVDTRWALVDDLLIEILTQVKDDIGSWRQLALALDIPERYFRKVRAKKLKTVSYNMMDRITTRSSISHRLRQLEWYTVDELLAMGIWKPQLPHLTTEIRKAA